MTARALVMGRDNWLIKTGDICILTILQPESPASGGWKDCFLMGPLLGLAAYGLSVASCGLSSVCTQLVPPPFLRSLTLLDQGLPFCILSISATITRTLSPHTVCKFWVGNDFVYSKVHSGNLSQCGNENVFVGF